jgi:hypothetical protein
MVTFLEHYACPPHLDDEALLIETSGEMPEVALAESLLHLGAVSAEDEDCLRGAVVRGYLHIIRRDLDPANVGASSFRGSERALANYRRLLGFLARVQGDLDPATLSGLARGLDQYLGAEEAGLAKGRPYATCRAEDVRELAGELGLDLRPWAPLLARLEDLPAVDFLGLRALKRMEGVHGRLLRRERRGYMHLEVQDAAGRVKAGTALPLAGPDGAHSPENLARVELVCRLLDPAGGGPPTGCVGDA